MDTTDVLLPIRFENGAFRVFEVGPERLDWPELRQKWTQHKVKRPFGFVAPEEKLDVFFAYACRKAKVPISLGNVFNPAWSTLFLREIENDALVLSANLLTYVTGRGLFADHLVKLKHTAIIGHADSEKISDLRTLFENMDVQILPHPIQELNACEC